MTRPVALAAALVAASWAAPAVVCAQTATVEMTADRTNVAVGETFRVQVRADVSGAEATNFEVPRFDAFQVVSRRVARPMQFRFGFGNQQRVVQSSTVYDFTLRAVDEGTFAIEPAEVTVQGRKFESDPLQIVVGPGSGGAQPPTLNNPAPPGGEIDGAEFDSTAFLRTVVDKPEVHVGEQVTVTVYMYSRGGIRSSPTVHEEPETDGFWVHDLLPPNRMLEPHRQVVRGTAYNVYVLRRFAAFPLEAGELPVGGMEVTLRSGSVFDIFNQQSQDIRRQGPPVEVKVKALPEQGRPSGPVVVGDFELESDIDRTQVATGDAVTYRVVLRGTGNVRDARLELPEVEGLRILQPQVTDDIEAPGDRVGGSRTWEWLVVPEEPGTHRIPPLTLHTFDPATDSYEALRTDANTLLAAGNSVAAGDAADPAGTETVTESTGDDAPHLEPIRNTSDFGRGGAPLSTSRWFWAAAAVPPLSWLLLLLGGFVRRRAEARGVATASQRAVKKARRRLATAEKHASEGNPRAFYGEVFQVLKDVLEARLGEPVGGFTHAELRRHLLSRGMREEMVRRVVDELEGLEFARFSASGIQQNELESCMQRVQALLERLDRFVPNTKEAA